MSSLPECPSIKELSSATNVEDGATQPKQEPTIGLEASINECQRALSCIEEINQQKETYIYHIATCEGMISARSRSVRAAGEQSSTALRSINEMQTDLDEHKIIIMRQWRNSRALQLAYHELILSLVDKNTDQSWAKSRGEVLLAALKAAKEIHCLILTRIKMMKDAISQDCVPGAGNSNRRRACKAAARRRQSLGGDSAGS